MFLLIERNTPISESSKQDGEKNTLKITWEANKVENSESSNSSSIMYNPNLKTNNQTRLTADTEVLFKSTPGGPLGQQSPTSAPGTGFVQDYFFPVGLSGMWFGFSFKHITFTGALHFIHQLHPNPRGWGPCLIMGSILGAITVAKHTWHGAPPNIQSSWVLIPSPQSVIS